MGDINKLMEAASKIAHDEIPVGGGGGEDTNTIFEIMKAHPGKYFTGKGFKQLFEESGLTIKSPSTALFTLRKAGKIEKAKTGVYVYKSQ